MEPPSTSRRCRAPGARAEPVGDGLRAATTQRRGRLDPHLHARARTAVRRPSGARIGVRVGGRARRRQPGDRPGDGACGARAGLRRGRRVRPHAPAAANDRALRATGCAASGAWRGELAAADRGLPQRAAQRLRGARGRCSRGVARSRPRRRCRARRLQRQLLRRRRLELEDADVRTGDRRRARTRRPAPPPGRSRCTWRDTARSSSARRSRSPRAPRSGGRRSCTHGSRAQASRSS